MWGSKTSVLTLPKSVPGAPTFCVDNFTFKNPAVTNYFLTHFHADHYGGLAKGFKHGTIYCSEITAKLVMLRINVDRRYIHPLPMDTRVNIEGTFVTLIEANHCPGAAMMIFETPDGKKCLHCGDCRYHTRFQQNEELRKGGFDVLFLDTTYCDPSHDFPLQESAIKFVASMVKSNDFQNPGTLFLVGTYTIGKEEVFLAAARECGWKVYVHKQKKRILDCLGLSAEDAAMITTDAHASRLHVVPMGCINFKHMAMLLQMSNGRYKTVVGIRPTGWTFAGGAAGSGNRQYGATGRSPTGAEKALGVSREARGSLVLYGVPYSEHSSFSELKELVKLVAAKRIIPTVNAGSSEQARRLVQVLTS